MSEATRGMELVCPCCHIRYQREGALLQHQSREHAGWLRRKMEVLQARAAAAPAAAVRTVEDAQQSLRTDENRRLSVVAHQNTDIQTSNLPPPFFNDAGNEVLPDSDVENDPHIEIIDESAPERMVLDNPPAGIVYDEALLDDDYRREYDKNDGHAPFANQAHFNLASWFVRARVPGWAVNELLHKNNNFPIDPSVRRESFGNFNQLQDRSDEISDAMPQTWQKTTTDRFWTANHRESIEFRYRDPIPVIKWLLSRPWFAQEQHYTPVELTVDGERVYGELNSGTWWQEAQVTSISRKNRRFVMLIRRKSSNIE